jgi:dienelactone hydrolase
MQPQTRYRRLIMVTATLLAITAALGALWWMIFALEPYDITPAQLAARYEHRTPGTGSPQVRLGNVEPVTVGATPAWAAPLQFASFDGTPAIGRIVYPADPRLPAAAGARRPVLLALHGMGRTHWRWWQPQFKGRPTIESTHLLAERALQAGHVVLALDARGHGERKDPARPLISSQLLRGLHLWGRREPYERLIVDTVRDWRVLLDWVQQHPQLDPSRVRAAGYSMGAQMALLLAGTDSRVRSVAAMVPPHLDAKVAAVAPATVAPRLAGVEVWLLTADDDEHAEAADNAALFAALPGARKRHLRFPGGHVLPASYVERLQPWLAQGPATGAEGSRGPALGGAQLMAAASSPNALSFDPGVVRKATFMRFHPLMAATRKVSSASSSSEKCSRACA